MGKKAYTFKMCRDCLNDKDLSEFYLNLRMSDGYENVCKACTNERRVRHNRRNKEQKAEADRRYRMRRAQQKRRAGNG